MPKPFFSVIIPVFNAAATLDNCLGQVFNSDFKDFEVIIVDDNSSDSSVSIARGFNCAIIELKENAGEGNARNKGARLACGKYLFFLDSDIYMESNTLRIIYDKIKKDNFDCVSAVYDTKSLYPDIFSAFKHLYDANYMLGLAGESNQFCCSAVAVKKEAFEKVGGFNPVFRCNADRDLSFRISDLGYSVYHDREAKVRHDKKYDLRRLIRVSFNRGFNSCRVYRALGKTKQKLSGAQFGYVAGIFLIPAAIAALCFNYFLAFFLLVLFYMGHLKFLSFIKKNAGWKVFFKSIPVLLIDNAAIAAGSLRAIFGFKK